MNCLLIDVRDQIFLTLPVKTLVICTSVCKSWQLSIRNPRFIEAHIQHHRCDIWMIRTYHKDNREAYSLRIDNDSLTEYVRYECPFTYTGMEPHQVIGSCNGVMCILDENYGIRNTLYLWNPAIHKYVTLPAPDINYDPRWKFDDVLGFEFDAKTNEYKVVRIVEFFDGRRSPFEVDVYSLRTGTWRNISHLISNVSLRNTSRQRLPPQAYLNGASHWLCTNSELSQHIIIVFHFGNEEFYFFKPQTSLNLGYITYSRVEVIRGSLSFVQSCNNWYCIWIMKEYGVSSSWEKILDYNFFSTVDRLIGFRKDGKLLIQIKGDLYSFDPEAAQGKLPYVLNDNQLSYWNALQRGDIFDFGGHSEKITFYDPKVAPQKLDIRTKGCIFSFHCKDHVDSLALLETLVQRDGESEED